MPHLFLLNVKCSPRRAPRNNEVSAKSDIFFSWDKKNEIMLEVICFRNIWYSNEVKAVEIFKNYNFPIPEVGLPAPIFIANKMT